MHLAHHHHPEPEEVDCLIRNAELRDEIEPYLDESISEINFRLLPTPMENRFLESMLAWERAPLVSIARWLTMSKSITVSGKRLKNSSPSGSFSTLQTTFPIVTAIR